MQENAKKSQELKNRMLKSLLELIRKSQGLNPAFPGVFKKINNINN